MSTISTNSSSTNYGTASLSPDIAARVQQTLSAANPSISKLNNTLTRDQTKLSALGQLQSALSSFQSIAQGLAGAGLSTSASTSVAGIATASTTSTAKAGSHTLDVQQLAQGQFLTSDNFPATDGKIGSGAGTTVKIDFGTASNPFVPGAASKTITLDGTNNTLDGIAAAFQAAGVNASVVKGDNGYSLQITGQSGAANSMRISVSGDAALKDLLAYDPDNKTNQKLTQAAAAQDAIVNVDGKGVTSPTNKLDSAIAGVSVTLTGKGKTTLTVTQDRSQIGSNIQAFVSAYNDLNQKLQAQQSGDLKSDTALGQVTSQLSQLLRTGGGVSLAALSKAGITLDSGSGNLKLDKQALQTALNADSDGVSQLFTNKGRGLADLLGAKAAAFTGTSGAIAREANSTNKELAQVSKQRTALSNALTAQATALAAYYSKQAASGSGSAVNGTGATSLFDMLA